MGQYRSTLAIPCVAYHWTHCTSVRRYSRLLPGRRRSSSQAWGGRDPVILDGVAALTDVVTTGKFGSVVQAVAAHAIFIHPDTVAQTGNHAVFPVIRGPVAGKAKRPIITLNGRSVMLDTNTTPTLMFLWAAARRPGRDVQYNHIWPDAKYPAMYTALWNLCVTPAFLAKTTDGRNHPEVTGALRYHAFDFYHACPPGVEPPKPEGYDELQWAKTPPALPDLLGASGELRSQRTSTIYNVVLGAVCRDCNNGWMSELENATRAIKSAITINASSNYRPLYQPNVITGFKQTLLPPPSAYVDTLWHPKHTNLQWFQSQEVSTIVEPGCNGRCAPCAGRQSRLPTLGTTSSEELALVSQ